MGTHRPLAVMSYEGMPFVKCSCTNEHKPQSAVWLREHWAGTEDEGIAALKAVVARQREAAREDAS